MVKKECAKLHEIEAGKIFSELHPTQEIRVKSPEPLEEVENDHEIVQPTLSEPDEDTVTLKQAERYEQAFGGDLQDIVSKETISEDIELNKEPLIEKPKEVEEESEEEKGEALKIAAKKAGVGETTPRKTERIVDAAKTNKEISKKWDDAKRGKTTTHAVYKKLKYW